MGGANGKGGGGGKGREWGASASSTLCLTPFLPELSFPPPAADCWGLTSSSAAAGNAPKRGRGRASRHSRAFALCPLARLRSRRSRQACGPSALQQSPLHALLQCPLQHCTLTLNHKLLLVIEPCMRTASAISPLCQRPRVTTLNRYSDIVLKQLAFAVASRHAMSPLHHHTSGLG